MIIKCVICKKEFEQQNQERKCGTHRNPMFYRFDGRIYIRNMEQHYQDPIYQYFKLVSSDEEKWISMPYKQRTRKILKKWEDLSMTIA